MEIYVDDVVVFGQSAELCLKNMRTVLAQAQQFNLEINSKKLRFLKRRIIFLEHEI